MSHLTVVAEIPPPEPDASEIGEEPGEEQLLLGGGSKNHTRPKKREEIILTQTFSLLPDFTLSHQVQRHRE